MKLLFTFLLIFIIAFSGAQTASVKVKVSDFEDVPLAGEEIWFKGKETDKIVKGLSDKTGRFIAELPGGDVYTIMVIGIDDQTQYSSIEIPNIGPGEHLSGAEIGIMINEPTEFTLDNVQFETDSSKLKTSSFKQLDQLVNYLLRKSDIKLEIAGHTDNVGDKESNQSLSKNRADAVRSYLVKNKVASYRLTAKGYGDAKPVADNASFEGKQLNRRVEVYFK